jgi:hypothetical protein
MLFCTQRKSVFSSLIVINNSFQALSVQLYAYLAIFGCFNEVAKVFWLIYISYLVNGNKESPEGEEASKKKEKGVGI